MVHNEMGALRASDAAEITKFEAFLRLKGEMPTFLAYWAVYGELEHELPYPGSCRDTLFLDPEDKDQEMLDAIKRSHPQVLDLTSR